MRLIVCVAAWLSLSAVATLQQPAPTFGGGFASLDARRQLLVTQWVERFTTATGQKIEAGPFYDDVVSFSSKTTFDAITHALMTTRLTDASGASLGDALSLVDRVEQVRGEVAHASGDRQFRMYVRLKDNAIDTLTRSIQFKRTADNTVFHKGYPSSYRQQGGTPSIQFSVALDNHRADVDVDYRSSSFPAVVFNGHLTASNSDVRAGNNADRHTARWAGLENWWKSFFGIRFDKTPDAQPSTMALPKEPRAGKKTIDVMARDFLNAWLIEGDVNAAMGYVSERAYSCLAQDNDDPTDFDRGLAPFQLMMNLKAAHDALGAKALETAISGVRFPTPGLKVVTQPNHAQFVVYSVPDDVAAGFDCESRLEPSKNKAARAYGNFFGVTFNVSGRKDNTVALLWAQEGGFWKIVSWRTGADADDTPAPEAAPAVAITRIPADQDFAKTARAFLQAWLIQKDYDAAFKLLSAKSYACYDVERASGAPAATSLDDAGRKIRAALERVGGQMGSAARLDELLTTADPVNPLVRLMNHADSHTFTLTSLPNAVADIYDCAARARGAAVPAVVAPEYGKVYGLNLRFRTLAGDTPVLQTMWLKESDGWRIAAYAVEIP